MDPISQLHLNIHRFIDHTMVKGDATSVDIERICEEAQQYLFAAVAVNPFYVKMCAELLTGSSTAITCAVGFPLGATTSRTKVTEAEEAIANGAKEIDMMINLSALKNNEDNFVLDDICSVVTVAHPKQVLVKVIIETDLLNDEEKVRASQLIYKAGADFIKTSTGTRPGGATEEDIRLILAAVDNKIQAKAAGGIRNWETAKKMIAAGATRLGTSSGVKIIEEALHEASLKFDQNQ